MKFNVAAIQMASGTNVLANLTEAARLIRDAAQAGAQVVVLPENFAIMGMAEEDKVSVVDTPFGRIGMAICYDLRFPELFRELAMQGAQVTVVPSAFTAITGKAHWEVLVRARAVENLCFVVASAQGGYHVNGRETHGNSMIVDPWGNVLDQLESGSGFVITEIDTENVEKIRQSFPALNHRKLNCNLSH